MAFSGLVFFLSEELPIRVAEDCAARIRLKNGVVAEKFGSRVTHCVAPRHSKEAPLSLSVEYVTPYWIERCDQENRLIQPDENPFYCVYRPFSTSPSLRSVSAFPSPTYDRSRSPPTPPAVGARPASSFSLSHSLSPSSSPQVPRSPFHISRPISRAAHSQARFRVHSRSPNLSASRPPTHTRPRSRTRLRSHSPSTPRSQTRSKSRSRPRSISQSRSRSRTRSRSQSRTSSTRRWRARSRSPEGDFPSNCSPPSSFRTLSTPPAAATNCAPLVVPRPQSTTAVPISQAAATLQPLRVVVPLRAPLPEPIDPTITIEKIQACMSPIYCRLCNVPNSCGANFILHLNGKKHTRQLANNHLPINPGSHEDVLHHYCPAEIWVQMQEAARSSQPSTLSSSPPSVPLPPQPAPPQPPPPPISSESAPASAPPTTENTVAPSPVPSLGALLPPADAPVVAEATLPRPEEQAASLPSLVSPENHTDAPLNFASFATVTAFSASATCSAVPALIETSQKGDASPASSFSKPGDKGIGWYGLWGTLSLTSSFYDYLPSLSARSAQTGLL